MTDIKNQPTSELLNTFIWGELPKNLSEIRKELEDRGVDITGLVMEVNQVIRKYEESVKR